MRMLKKIEEYIDKCIEAGDIYGASFSLITPQGINQYYHGTQGRDEFAIGLDPAMIYDLASVTKVVGTTTRIFQLLSDHTIHLTDSVARFLPGFTHPEITIQNLLLHNSGLPADIDHLDKMQREDLIKAVYDAPLIATPGTTYVYSDLGFILLGWIIRAVDGSLARSIQDHVLYPLAMTNTGYNLNRPKVRFVPTEFDSLRGQIQGQVHDYKAFLLNGESGHAGLFSTLTDLSVFVEMMLNFGEYQGKRVLDENVFDWLGKYDEHGRTLGWERHNGQHQYFHTGFTGPAIAFDLDRQVGLVVLTNRVYPTSDNQVWNQDRQHVFDLFFEAD
ncbi:class A beta-lactamase-related serine hydrolase [Lactiplantibacillus pentosus]|jgi:CubicO group peptidase (beta-lactamase class C family)|uniref:serine hydrolase domain-containing protein n=1 Tax=Lactiplantibacillus pentosus TaxID=1589 RepID=UPI001CFF8DD4|nr:serine hydrolase domain-containing protein [Lactiplantibacillus pentosus]MCB5223130.1 beta-lactamase family protein [Lactiplantibacillus pentosus]MCT3291272.1 class A beta-lactamase-related serine hydrolase [Lactiplantibacillus pentosus]